MKGNFCKTKLKEAFPGVREEVLEDIIDQFEFFRKTARSQKEMNDMAHKYYKEFSRKSKIVVENKKVNALRIQEETDFIISEFGERPWEGLEAIVTGKAGSAFGSGNSISSYALAISQEAFSILNHGLNTTRLLKFAKSGELDRDIFKLAHARRNGLPDPTDIDPRAIELGEIYFKVSNKLQDQVEAAGSLRGRAEAYMGKRSYDGLKAKDMGEEQFIEFMMENLDLKKTFGPQFDDPNFIRESLKENFNDIVLDRIDVSRVRADGPDFLAIFKQGSKDARKSKSRHFMFKSGDAEFEVHQRLGKEIVLQDVVEMIGRDSRYAAAMQRLGPDFDRNWEAIKSNVSQRVGTDQNKKLIDKIKTLDGVYQVTVNGFQTGSSPLAKATVAAKALTKMTMLGGVTPVSATSDLASHAINIRNIEGKNIYSATFDSMLSYAKDLSIQGKAREDFYLEMGSYYSNGLGEYHSRFSPDEIVIGSISKMQDMFYRLNGQTYQSGHWQMANEHKFGRVLAEAVGNPNLRPETDLYLNRYGIGPEERKILQGAVKNGRLFMPYVDDLDIPAAQKAKLKLKVGSFLKENASRISHPSPNERARFLLDLGLDKNTPLGAAVSLAGDLKSFPVTMMNVTSQILRNRPDAAGLTAMQALKTPEGIKTMAVMIASLSIAGTMGLAFREMSQNRKPDFEDPKFLLRGMMMGGALGLYGDFILQDHSERFGPNLSEMLMGPVIGGPVTDILETVTGIVIGQGENLRASNEVRKIWSRIPGNNLFYTKALLDYYILENLQESVEPGFKNKKRRNQRRRGVEPLVE